MGKVWGKSWLDFVLSLFLKDGTKCSYKQSLVRNITLSVPVLVGIIPVWGWLLTLLMALPIIGLEIYLMMKLDSAHRLGDVLADTMRH